jgi:hypothetical protein
MQRAAHQGGRTVGDARGPQQGLDRDDVAAARGLRAAWAAGRTGRVTPARLWYMFVYLYGESLVE